MTKSAFYLLSLALVVEILIGYGMLFGLQEQSIIIQQDVLVFNKEQENILHQDTYAYPNVGGGQAGDQLLATANQELPLSETSEDQEPPSADTLASQREPIQIRNAHIAPQGQLVNPPEVLKAVYLTSWSGGSKARIDYVINLAKTAGVNAVVIDIKDFSGEVAYDIVVPEVTTYGAKNIRIWRLDATLKRLHNAGIYTIARVTVFQDPLLAKARPDLAVHSEEKLKELAQNQEKKEGEKEGEQTLTFETIWTDYKGLGWIDPANKEAWKYTVAIARDAASRGFDEINFDYVRFPSDGNLKDMNFPAWDGQKPKHEVIKDFFAYLQEHLQDVRISADLFGLTTSSRDDLGIGQIIEDAYWHFNYVYPMVYPSHYANGYNGYANPAEYPYEVVKNSMESAVYRLRVLQKEHPEEEFAKLRPWLQDFDLGAEYDALMVQAQIEATTEAMGNDFAGFLLWAPTNWYTIDALQPFVFDQTVYSARLNPQTQEIPTEISSQ
jgi:hypothetical protein